MHMQNASLLHMHNPFFNRRYEQPSRNVDTSIIPDNPPKLVIDSPWGKDFESRKFLKSANSFGGKFKLKFWGPRTKF